MTGAVLPRPHFSPVDRNRDSAHLFQALRRDRFPCMRDRRKPATRSTRLWTSAKPSC